MNGAGLSLLFTVKFFSTRCTISLRTYLSSSFSIEKNEKKKRCSDYCEIYYGLVKFGLPVLFEFRGIGTSTKRLSALRFEFDVLIFSIPVEWTF